MDGEFVGRSDSEELEDALNDAVVQRVAVWHADTLGENVAESDDVAHPEIVIVVVKL